MSFMVIQGYWLWCHSIGHIRFPTSLPLQLCLYLTAFPRYYYLFPKLSRGHVTLNTSLWDLIYHACTFGWFVIRWSGLATINLSAKL